MCRGGRCENRLQRADMLNDGGEWAKRVVGDRHASGKAELEKHGGGTEATRVGSGSG